ncbi:polysaccharide pyruvyl transferase family protein [Rhodococcus sp. BP-316]|uniref:polysaccharide pyruvyl transferase family protein n=1 Tax=Rhodococcus sp. BP-316 TaxID=2739445 RepID=UPI001C9B6710|nr:polysaccharide pyruvyl transferase family protein [Rhodococcus sp. BP-316]MBY6683242.1 polysaccharide pyruvyl transferase family protein [Rhodococcus sp. BP-316]
MQALAEGSACLAKSAFPDCEVEFQSYGMIQGIEESLGLRSILLALRTSKSSITQWLKTFDFVIDTGAGDSFSDIYGFRRLLEMSALRIVIRRAGLPFVMGPQTVGPFETRIGRALARQSLKGCSVLIARDPISMGASSRIYDGTAVLASDVAFLLPKQPAAKRFDLLFNVSGLLWEENKHIEYSVYRQYVFEFIEEANSAGVDVTLLNHVLDSPDSDNDAPAAQHVREQLSNLDLAVETPKSLEHARSLIAGASVVLASRMHASLNSISQGVPAVSWAYSRKFEPLFDALDWPYTFDLRSPGADLVEQTLASVLQLRQEGAPAVEVASNARSALLSATRSLNGLAS